MKLTTGTTALIILADTFLPLDAHLTLYDHKDLCFHPEVKQKHKREDEWVTVLTDSTVMKMDAAPYWEQIGKKKYKTLNELLNRTEQTDHPKKQKPLGISFDCGLTTLKCEKLPYTEHPQFVHSGFSHEGLYSITVNRVETFFARKDTNDNDLDPLMIDYSQCLTAKYNTCIVEIDWLGMRPIKKKLQAQRYKWCIKMDVTGLKDDKKWTDYKSKHIVGEYDKITDKNGKVRTFNDYVRPQKLKQEDQNSKDHKGSKDDQNAKAKKDKEKKEKEKKDKERGDK